MKLKDVAAFHAVAVVRPASTDDPWALIADAHGCALWLPPRVLPDLEWQRLPAKPHQPTQLELSALAAIGEHVLRSHGHP